MCGTYFFVKRMSSSAFGEVLDVGQYVPDGTCFGTRDMREAECRVCADETLCAVLTKLWSKASSKKASKKVMFDEAKGLAFIKSEGRVTYERLSKWVVSKTNGGVAPADYICSVLGRFGGVLRHDKGTGMIYYNKI